jgi:hypothetical protein
MGGSLGTVSMLCGLALIWAHVGVPLPFAEARALPQFPPTGLPPCGGNISFPSDVQLVEPAASLPQESVALVGVWEGSFAEGANPSAGAASTLVFGAAVRLAVEQVTPGRARIVLGYGPVGNSPGSWSAHTVPMTDGRLQVDTTPVTVFQLSNDRQNLSATIDRASGRSGVRLTRCTMGETVVTHPTSSTAAGPASATAAAAPLPPPGRVLYQDSFADPTSGWPRQASNPDTLVAGYENCEYYVNRPARGPGWSWMSRSRESFADFQLEVDARLVGPAGGAYLAVGFRRQANGDHYDFIVEPEEQTYRLLARANDSVTTLISRTPSAMIREGAATNRLGVWMRGNEIVLLVNGQQVGRARDDKLPQGALTLGAGHRAEGRTEARYANLVVMATK